MVRWPSSSSERAEEGERVSEKLIFTCTHAKDDPERATLPFIIANTAAVAGQEAVVLCTIEGVWLGTEDGAEGIAHTGMPVLSELLGEFIDNGGEIWLCGSCTKPRGITEDRLVKGAKITGAAKVIEEAAAGAKTLTYT
jgi:predicted peroxiredoxin